jgi:hypothetical protein
MKSMPILVALLTVLAVAAAAVAQVRVESTPSEPAWCGGSYHATGGLDAGTFHSLDAQTLPPSGTNFGECTPITRDARGVQGDTTISVPTHPAIPAGQVVFDKGVPILVTSDADGKETRVELLPPKP